MAKISRDDIKKRGLKRFFQSFKYSIQGLKYAYKYKPAITNKPTTHNIQNNLSTFFIILILTPIIYY